MKKIAAMTAIIALVSMPVLVPPGRADFPDPARRKPARRPRKTAGSLARTGA